MPPHTDTAVQLRNLALLYLAMGHGADNYLSGSELETITDRLHARYSGHDRSSVQDIVGEAMAVYMQSDNVMATAVQVIAEMRVRLPEEQRRAILDDLLAIAQADGVVLHNERVLMRRLAQSWGVKLQPEAPGFDSDEERMSGWDILHHLALIYLVLAHGTDNDLSEQERVVMLRKLEEWAPRHDQQEIREILDTALGQYSAGVSDTLFAHAVEAVKQGMPHAQRMAALDDLVKIANADGVFLDREEDLINQLLTAWNVQPYASYGRHGTKSQESDRS